MMGEYGLSNARKDGLVAAFRNARYLFLPFSVSRKLGAYGSAMMGVLPLTVDWFTIYPNTKSEPALDIWKKFKRRHDVAGERARAVRHLMQNDYAILRNPHDEFKISLRWPDIYFVGCVGASLTGKEINYMDIVGVYPRRGDLSFTLDGGGEEKTDGSHTYQEFQIGIGDGIFLKGGSIVELKYKEDAINSALEKCPEEYQDWLKNMRRIRRIDHIKEEGGKISVCVSSHRYGSSNKEYCDIEDITGRVFVHYDRLEYEAQLKEHNLWEGLSFAARVPDLLKPDCELENFLGDFSDSEIGVINDLLCGVAEEESDDTRALVKRFLSKYEKASCALIELKPQAA